MDIYCLFVYQIFFFSFSSNACQAASAVLCPLRVQDFLPEGLSLLTGPAKVVINIMQDLHCFCFHVFVLF